MISIICNPATQPSSTAPWDIHFSYFAFAPVCAEFSLRGRMQVSHTVVTEPAKNGLEIMRLVMVPQFDIFRVLSDKEPLWIEAAMTLEDAITRVRQIGAVQSGKYFIHSQKTHVEIAMTVRRSANVVPKFSTRSEPVTVRLHPRVLCKPKK
ncbi:MAG: hypothetical protein WBL50_07885 [Candidatus Acidiferrum sp.]